MVLSSKVALCISGAAAIVSGGFLISYIMKREPKVITLEDTSVVKPAENKWWSDYEDRNNLVADVIDNEAWWNWKYRYTFRHVVRDSRKKETQLDEPFKNVKMGYSGQELKEINSPISLNKACWIVYGKEKTEVSNSEKLKKNIKDFCSIKKNKTEAKLKR